MTRRAGAADARVVVLGGGTGISPCLSGIKPMTDAITAIVTVADDGGSSGRLRKDYDMQPPGDIRNCLVALSSVEPVLKDLFSYRFEDSLLRGHAFGNLFLAVLTRLTGDFRQAIERARSILNVRGRVLPATDRRVVLVAEHADGTKSTGEQRISRSRKPVVRLELRPEPPPVSQEIEQAVTEADLIVLGPGSLLTSIIPNLLVPGMAAAISRAPGKVVLVANLATQPGETDGFDLERHVAALRELGGLARIDVVLVHEGSIPTEAAARYAATGAELLPAPPAERIAGVPVVRRDVAHLDEDGKLRHHGPRLAAALREILAGETEVVR
ncbi:MAG TPA: uridine diphosphate-N-acetylglucosamine-binding protein YvcK [Planctomycetota bacterium]|nr:uridine diphosphate-N-acetylglucosamine-binding protein YvcK [Planctomycetota bacterium]